MRPIPLGTVIVPEFSSFEELKGKYDAKGIRFPPYLLDARNAFDIQVGPVEIELACVIIGDLIPKLSGRAEDSLEFSGVSLMEVYREIRALGGQLLTHREALFLPLSIPIPGWETEEKGDHVGKAIEGTWYRFAMQTTQVIRGSSRILCMGSDQRGPRLDENLADGSLLWAAVERFVFVTKRMCP